MAAENDDRDLPQLVRAETGAAPARRRKIPVHPFVLFPLIPVLMISGAVMGMYFQPAPLRAIFERTGWQPGGGASVPIALPPEITLPRDVAETIIASDVVGLARLMPLGDVITVAPPFGAGDARITAILVAEGDEVAQDQLLAQLDNISQLESAALTAQANVAVREATLAQTTASIRAAHAEAQAVLEQAEAAHAEATTGYERTQALAGRGVATPATLDSARTAERQAALAVNKARATLDRYTAPQSGPPLDVIVAERNLDAASAELARAQKDLARAEVRAPVGGTILSIEARAGERPPAGGILQMGDTSQMMARVEVYQDRIARVAIGQPVELVATAIGKTLRGKVTSIGLTVGRQGLLPDDTVANTDARVVAATVALDAESTAIARHYTNLEVVARIDTRPPK